MVSRTPSSRVRVISATGSVCTKCERTTRARKLVSHLQEGTGQGLVGVELAIVSPDALYTAILRLRHRAGELVPDVHERRLL